MTLFHCWNPIESFWIIEIWRLSIAIGMPERPLSIDFSKAFVGVDIFQYQGYYVEFWNFRKRIHGYYKPQRPVQKEINWEKRIDFQTRGVKMSQKTNLERELQKIINSPEGRKAKFQILEELRNLENSRSQGGKHESLPRQNRARA